MANEFSYQFQINLTNGTLKDGYTSSGMASNQSTAALVRNVQAISNAAHSALDLGSVVTAGFAVFVNLDATNYIDIGVDVAAAFVPFARVEAGKGILVKLATAAPYAKSSVAPANLFYIIYAA